MALIANHSKFVTVPDDGVSPVGTNEWNADHPISGTINPGDYGLAASATTDATNASNLTSGTLPAARLPLTSATLANGQPANPTGTTSGTTVMMGLGTTAKITPVYSGRVRFEIWGSVNNSGTGNSVGLKFFFGTGTAPVNGAAQTGTQIGAQSVMISVAGGAEATFKVGGTTLTAAPGTALWFDVGLLTTAGIAGLFNLTCEAWEY